MNSKQAEEGLILSPTRSNNNNSNKNSTKIGKFSDKYNLGDKLGEGAFAIVKVCTLKAKPVNKAQEKAKYAVKIVKREGLSKDEELALRTEVSILQSCNHVNIVNCVDFYEEPKQFYIVMELCEGGELFDRIVAKVAYSELEARGIVRELLNALNYIHSRNIVHRDLKLENLLLMYKESDEDVKLADFGFACKVEGNSLTTLCGTPGYVAPEILFHKPYGKAVDMWSIGVIIYIILGGYPPFSDPNQKKLFEQIKKGIYEFHPDYWNHISPDAKDLIRNLLVVNPQKRFTALHALNHKWLCTEDERLSTINLDLNLKALKRFNAKRKFRAGIKAIIAANRFGALMASAKSATGGGGGGSGSSSGGGGGGGGGVAASDVKINL